MNEFDDIRPYYDSEAPWLVRPVVSYTLRSSFSEMQTVSHLHGAIRESFGNLLVKIGSVLTVTGLEKLDRNTPYLFISNHRDIAMDPAFVNVALLDDDRDSVRIAIGDNLLTKQFVSDLARVNKSFVVKRSVAGRREKMTALMQLSRYIRSSLIDDKSSVWIAQREGRAKNGMDKTEPALLKMLTFSKQKDQTFGNALRELNVVPVAISYEFDPLDAEKGLELLEKSTKGSYEKNEHEDFSSIYQGIIGRKGAVHVSFGAPLVADYSSAGEAAIAMDQQIIGNYKLHATNLLAYHKLHKPTDETDIMISEIDCDWVKKTHEFNQRINSIAPECQKIVLEMYANPVSQKINHS
jgi:1-acyl-sn-glycerol-3-phosphate acyltransferase